MEVEHSIFELRLDLLLIDHVRQREGPDEAAAGSLDPMERLHFAVMLHYGKPIAILSAVSKETFEESLAAVRRARAVAAVEQLQRQSVRAGTDKLSPAEIAAEVRASRKARRR